MYFKETIKLIFITTIITTNKNRICYVVYVMLETFLSMVFKTEA